MSDFKVKFNNNSFAMKWHEKTYPEIDEVVICRVKQINDYGIQVNILNYGNIDGFLAINELSRKKIKSIRSVIKVGDIKPLVVIRKDLKNNQMLIDLSKKQLSDIEIEIDKLENIID